MSIHDEVKDSIAKLYKQDQIMSFSIIYNYICDVERYFELQEMWNLDNLLDDTWTDELGTEYTTLREKLTKGMK